MHEVDLRPPLPEVKLVLEETFSGHDRIVASGIDEYIGTYHKAGWLRALNDGRLLRASDVAAEMTTKDIEKVQSVFRAPLRVKDVFCFYFLQREGEALANEWKADGTWEQRDAVIADVIGEIERRGASGGQPALSGSRSAANKPEDHLR
jgi:hypothetical protein